MCFFSVSDLAFVGFVGIIIGALGACLVLGAVGWPWAWRGE